LVTMNFLFKIFFKNNLNHTLSNMKKQTIIALLLMFYYICPMVAQTCTGNLLQNAGFESGLTNWDGNGEIVTTGANTGTKAVKVCTYGFSSRQTITAQAGKTYTLNGFLKKDATANVFVFLKFLNSSFTPLVAPYAQWQGQSTTWSAFDPLVWLAPSGTAYIEVSLVQNGGTGCVFADDFCLTSGTIASTCLKNYALSEPYEVVSGEKTATGYRTIARDRNNTNMFLTSTYDANRDLVTQVASAAPARFYYNINGNLEKRNASGTLLYSKPLPSAITNLYGVMGTGTENPSGGYYLAMNSGQNTVVLKTDANFVVLSTKTFNSTNTSAAQTPAIIITTPDGGYLYGINVGSFQSATTRFLKVNSSNTTQYEFPLTGQATWVYPSPLTNRYFFETLKTGNAPGSGSIFNFYYDVELSATTATQVYTFYTIQNSGPGFISNTSNSTLYANGFSISFESNNATNTSTGITSKYFKVERYDGTNLIPTYTKLLSTVLPNEFAVPFEKGTQNAIIIGKNWSFDTECGTISGLNVSTPTDVSYTECLAVSGGPSCTNCHTIVPPTVTTTCPQGGATVVYDGYTTLSGTMTVNDPNGPLPNNIPVFGFVTRGFGQVEVRFKATDACGNTATTSYKISNTQTDPAITYTSCPSNIVVTAATGQTTAIVTYPTPTITALCGPTAASTSNNTASGSNFPIGTTQVTWTAANALQTKLCQFTVTVNPSGTGGGTCANNLLQNASFESDLASWGNDGGAVTIVTGGNTGTKSVKICANGARIYQTKSAVAGKTYTASTFAKNDANGSVFGNLTIKFLNASFSPIGQVNAPISALSGAFYQSTISLLAPTNSTYVEVSLQKTDGMGCIFIDDVCLTDGGTGGGNNLPDLNLANLNISNPSLAPGQILNFNFDLKNTGAGNATGNYNIKSYISTDNVLSANDIQDGIVPTGNLIAGATIPQVTGAATIPANLAAGSYYLILKVDADNAIAESDENNNELKRVNPFIVTTNTGSSPCQKTYEGRGDLNTICAKSTASGYSTINITYTNQLRQRNYDADGNLFQEQVLGISTIPTFQYVVTANKITKYDNATSAILSTTNLPVALNITDGAAVEIAGGGWWLAYLNPALTTNAGVLLKLNAALQVITTVTNLPFSTVSNQKPLYIHQLPNNEILVAAQEDGSQQSGTKFVKINASNAVVSNFGFVLSGKTTQIGSSPCDAANLIILGGNYFVTPGGSVNVSTQVEGKLTATGLTPIQVYNFTQNSNGGLQVGNNAISQSYLPNGDFWRLSYSEQVVPAQPATFTLAKWNAAANSILVQKTVPTPFDGRGVFNIFEKANNEVIVFGKTQTFDNLWSYNSACGSTGGGGTGADLEVTLTGDKTNVPQWSGVTLTATAKNTGNQAVTNAVIALSVCPGNVAFGQTSGLVYESIPTAPSLGTYNYVTQNWTINNLLPGQSATLTVKLFALTAGQKKISAASLQQSPNDPDSQPSTNDIPNCTPSQDDEAVWTINMGQGLLVQGERDVDEEKTFFEKMSFLDAYSVFPNPAGESVFVKTPDNQSITKVSLLNQMGKVEKIQEFSPTISTNNVVENIQEFPLQDVSNGVYFLKIETAGQRTVVRKLVVSRMY
jgi:CARDB/HYR domain/Secretion system C-terminal sorting domain/Domain of unknown function DUF11